jgi:serine O-acetyltransferase
MLHIYRLSHWLHRARVPLLPRLLYLLNRVVFGVVLPPSVELGKGSSLGYSGLGTVIHARARIGAGVRIGTGVTVGGRCEEYEVPIIEDGVQIGSGAKIIGPVRIGQGAQIGANAVVLRDVPSGATAVGVPAKIILRRRAS